MELAPILVSVYNREKHFVKCIESLKQCNLSKNSHLFIAIDYPINVRDIESNKRIIDYSRKIIGFKEITLIIRSTNFGAHRNIQDARKIIFSKYDKLIFSEDDNIFAKNFLVNINKCLDVYKNRKDILSVSGWNMPFKFPKNYKNEIYIWQGFSAWGVGLWREKWKQINYSLDKVQYWLNNKQHIKKINNISQHYYYALLKMKKNKIINGDGFICNYLVENQMYSIFPKKTLTVNIGHDGMGNNKFLNTKIKNQKINNDIISDFPHDLKPDRNINNRLWWYFSNVNRLKDRFIHYYLKKFYNN